jgi:cell division control protein 24
MIKHTNEENLNHWKKMLQRQRELFSRADTPGRGRSGTASTQFAWMAAAGPEDPSHGQSNAEISDEDDDATLAEENGRYSGITLASSRNGSSTSLRSRPNTNESMPQSQPNGYLPRQASGARFPIMHMPPLTLNTNPAIQNLGNSPDRNNSSYFSPVETPKLNGRTSATPGQGYPFPRHASTNYYEEPSHFTPPSMSRTSSREGVPAPTSYAAYQGSSAYQNGQRLQRPSLPGMASTIQQAPATTQNRLRSASSPNIHHIPKISIGGTIPPVPTLPGSYVPSSYSSGPLSRSPTGSPTSPSMAGYGQRQGSEDQLPGVDVPPGSKSQVKVKIHYNNDKLAIIVPYNIAYSQLIDRIERKVRICGNGPEISLTSPIRIRYQDEDGDLISMNSDDDVQMAFDVGSESNCNDSGGTTSVTLYVQIG